MQLGGGAGAASGADRAWPMVHSLASATRQLKKLRKPELVTVSAFCPLKTPRSA